MKPLRSVIAVVLAALCAAPALALPPNKLVLQYDMSRNGTPMVEVVERLEHDGKQYTLSFEGKGKGVYALARSGAVKRSSRGAITAGGLKPAEFRDRRGDKPEHVARFEWAKGTLSQGEEGKPETRPLPDGATDRLAFLWSFAFAKPGKDLRAIVSDGKGTNELHYVAAGTETIKTPAGDIEALRLVKQKDAGDDRGTEVWLAVKQDYVPVRILVIEKDGTRIDQVVTSIARQ